MDWWTSTIYFHSMALIFFSILLLLLPHQNIKKASKDKNFDIFSGEWSFCFQVAKNINHLKNEFFTFSLRNDFFFVTDGTLFFFSSCLVCVCYCFVICCGIITAFDKVQIQVWIFFFRFVSQFVSYGDWCSVFVYLKRDEFFDVATDFIGSRYALL